MDDIAVLRVLEPCATKIVSDRQKGQSRRPCEGIVGKIREKPHVAKLQSEGAAAGCGDQRNSPFGTRQSERAKDCGGGVSENEAALVLPSDGGQMDKDAGRRCVNAVRNHAISEDVLPPEPALLIQKEERAAVPRHVTWHRREREEVHPRRNSLLNGHGVNERAVGAIDGDAPLVEIGDVDVADRIDAEKKRFPVLSLRFFHTYLAGARTERDDCSALDNERLLSTQDRGEKKEKEVKRHSSHGESLHDRESGINGFQKHPASSLLVAFILFLIPLSPLFGDFYLPLNSGLPLAQGSIQDAILVYGPSGEPTCVFLRDGAMHVTQSDDSGASFHELGISLVVGDLSEFRLLRSFRKIDGSWLVFFVAAVNGNEGIYALSFGSHGQVSMAYPGRLDRENPAGVVQKYEVASQGFDGIGLMYIKSGVIRLTRIPTETAGPITELQISPDGQPTDDFQMTSLPRAGSFELAGSFIARGQSNVSTGYAFVVDGDVLVSLTPLIPATSVGSLSLNVATDFDWNLVCLAKAGNTFTSFEWTANSWVTKSSVVVALDGAVFLPYTQPRNTDALVVGVQGGERGLYVGTAGSAGSYLLNLLSSGLADRPLRFGAFGIDSLFVGFLRAGDSADYWAGRFTLSSRSWQEMPLRIDGDSIIDATAFAMNATPHLLVLDKDSQGQWLECYDLGQGSGSFTQTGRVQLKGTISTDARFGHLLPLSSSVFLTAVLNEDLLVFDPSTLDHQLLPGSARFSFGDGAIVLSYDGQFLRALSRAR